MRTPSQRHHDHRGSGLHVTQRRLLPMNHPTWPYSHASNLARAGAAVLMASLGAACGGSRGATRRMAALWRMEGARPRPAAAQDAVGTSAAAVDLGAAGNFVILAKSGISTVPTSAVTGDLGVSPAAATYITGFSLTADPTNVFATSPQVTGKVFASTTRHPRRRTSRPLSVTCRSRSPTRLAGRRASRS